MFFAARCPFKALTTCAHDCVFFAWAARLMAADARTAIDTKYLAHSVHSSVKFGIFIQRAALESPLNWRVAFPWIFAACTGLILIETPRYFLRTDRRWAQNIGPSHVPQSVFTFVDRCHVQTESDAEVDSRLIVKTKINRYERFRSAS